MDEVLEFLDRHFERVDLVGPNQPEPDSDQYQRTMWHAYGLTKGWSNMSGTGSTLDGAIRDLYITAKRHQHGLIERRTREGIVVAHGRGQDFI